MIKVLSGGLVGLALTAVLLWISWELPVNFYFPAEYLCIGLGSLTGGYIAGKHGWAAGILGEVIGLLAMTLPFLIGGIFFLGPYNALLALFHACATFIKPLLISLVVSALAGVVGGWWRIKRNNRLT